MIAVDLPGFGRSDRITPSLELFVRWLGRFVDELELAPVAVVGNCMGSLAALHYASREPEKVSALVLINMVEHEVATAGPMGRGAGLLRFHRLRPLIERSIRHTPAQVALRHPYPNSQLGDLPVEGGIAYREHAVRCFSDPATRVALVRLGYTDEQAVLPSSELLERLPPICWIWGQANKLLPYEVGRRQLDVLEPAEVHVIEGRGYAVAWESPVEINRIIETFLDRHAHAREPSGDGAPMAAAR